MKNLVPSKENSKDVYHRVVSAMNSGDKKDALKNIFPRIKILLQSFNDKFSSSLDLITLNNWGQFTKDEGEYLESCYGSKRSDIKKIQRDLRDLNNISKCQFCTVNSISNELDHYLPISVYPEFSINPQNLLPICSDCNRLKSNQYIEHNIPLFINSYIDPLPKEQYLFVTIGKVDTIDDIEFTFSLENKNNIDQYFFKILETHYERLNLFTRFKNEAGNIALDLQVSISSQVRNTEMEKIRTELHTCLKENKERYGRNHYKVIIEESLINNADFVLLCNKQS